MNKSLNMAQMVRGQLWVHYQGQTFVYESAQKKNFSGKGSAKAQSGIITSPMPGKITKLFKVVGDVVTQGEALIVMEAMKMEYTLKADVAGKIAHLDCQVGEQVSLGRKLLVIEEGS